MYLICSSYLPIINQNTILCLELNFVFRIIMIEIDISDGSMNIERGVIFVSGIF